MNVLAAGQVACSNACGGHRCFKASLRSRNPPKVIQSAHLLVTSRNHRPLGR
jgi:hypothetical protein